jgi:hypothetical protein
MVMSDLFVILMTETVSPSETLSHHTGHGGSKLLSNVGQYLPDYIMQYPRR